MEEKVEMERAMQKHESELAFEKGVVQRTRHTHYQNYKVLMAKVSKFQKEV
jgi:hypothetical protein